MVLFISPGLTSREKKYLFALLPGTLLSFVAGCVFGYLVLLPPALNFLMTFGSDIATPMIRVGNYINLVINLKTTLVQHTTYFKTKVYYLSLHTHPQEKQLKEQKQFLNKVLKKQEKTLQIYKLNKW